MYACALCECFLQHIGHRLCRRTGSQDEVEEADPRRLLSAATGRKVGLSGSCAVAVAQIFGRPSLNSCLELTLCCTTSRELTQWPAAAAAAAILPRAAVNLCLCCRWQVAPDTLQGRAASQGPRQAISSSWQRSSCRGMVLATGAYPVTLCNSTFLITGWQYFRAHVMFPLEI